MRRASARKTTPAGSAARELAASTADGDISSTAARAQSGRLRRKWTAARAAAERGRDSRRARQWSAEYSASAAVSGSQISEGTMGARDRAGGCKYGAARPDGY